MEQDTKVIPKKYSLQRKKRFRIVCIHRDDIYNNKDWLRISIMDLIGVVVTAAAIELRAGKFLE